MAAVTSGLAGGALSAAKVEVGRTNNTRPNATFVSLLLMLGFPFIDWFTLLPQSPPVSRSCRLGDRAGRQPQHCVRAHIRPGLHPAPHSAESHAFRVVLRSSSRTSRS